MPYSTFTGCLKLEETSPIEPDVRGWKFYAPGADLVLDRNPDTGERLELVQIINN